MTYDEIFAQWETFQEITVHYGQWYTGTARLLPQWYAGQGRRACLVDVPRSSRLAQYDVVALEKRGWLFKQWWIVGILERATGVDREGPGRALQRRTQGLYVTEEGVMETALPLDGEGGESEEVLPPTAPGFFRWMLSGWDTGKTEDGGSGMSTPGEQAATPVQPHETPQPIVDTPTTSPPSYTVETTTLESSPSSYSSGSDSSVGGNYDSGSSGYDSGGSYSDSSGSISGGTC